MNRGVTGVLTASTGTITGKAGYDPREMTGSAMRMDNTNKLESPLSPWVGTVVLEAGEDLGNLVPKLEMARGERGKALLKIVVTCRPGKKAGILHALMAKFPGVEVVEIHSWPRDLAGFVPTQLMAYLPASAPYSPPRWEEMGKGIWGVMPWMPAMDLPSIGGMHLMPPILGWIAEANLLQTEFSSAVPPTFRDFETLSAEGGRWIPYLSAKAGSTQEVPLPPSNDQPRIWKDAKVLALIPYYNCRSWLEFCLRSLAEQTRPLDGILVLDDGSERPPLDIVEKFKGATLWRSPANVGPYRLIQSAIEQTRYDAYLFQDADDWSSIDRLELLLAEAERTGAELIGTQEVMYLQENAFPNTYPLDVNQALLKYSAYSLLHPSGLVSRDLVVRSGGYATGLRFSGDLEFQTRARFVGKMVNLDRFCYFRRIRKDSLITSEQTGLASPARLNLDAQIRKRTVENSERSSKGQPPLLEPLASAGTIELEHLTGPNLAGS